MLGAGLARLGGRGGGVARRGEVGWLGRLRGSGFTAAWPSRRFGQATRDGRQAWRIPTRPQPLFPLRPLRLKALFSPSAAPTRPRQKPLCASASLREAKNGLPHFIGAGRQAAARGDARPPAPFVAFSLCLCAIKPDRGRGQATRDKRQAFRIPQSHSLFSLCPLWLKGSSPRPSARGTPRPTKNPRRGPGIWRFFGGGGAQPATTAGRPIE